MMPCFVWWLLQFAEVNPGRSFNSTEARKMIGEANEAHVRRIMVRRMDRLHERIDNFADRWGLE